MSALIVGATGLCGNLIVKHAPEYFNKAYTISRSEPDFVKDNAQLEAILDSDSTTWTDKVKQIKKQDPECSTFFSGLGSTRAKSGGIENQRKIDLHLNLSLAKAAKEAGFTKYVLISSVGANAGSPFPYLKMKGELERDVIALDFEETIILRPGALLGDRKEDKGFLNNLGAKIGSMAYGTRFASYLMSPVYGEEVALAALKESQKKHDKKVTILSGNEVNKAAKA
ncbi:CYFA0S10e04280g1_1 [Cyberlindnera fabianii]|uniref:Protein FMP52, mitochondrial n=1 Tax=Cyberlindnera fabianii TaxID=36022 RepID=A0A061B5M2_CYBFA|nr:CYFA0S10e04280g1_1 [Cyberlindnera fabianii]